MKRPFPSRLVEAWMREFDDMGGADQEDARLAFAYRLHQGSRAGLEEFAALLRNGPGRIPDKEVTMKLNLANMLHLSGSTWKQVAEQVNAVFGADDTAASYKGMVRRAKKTGRR